MYKFMQNCKYNECIKTVLFYSVSVEFLRLSWHTYRNTSEIYDRQTDINISSFLYQLQFLANMVAFYPYQILITYLVISYYIIRSFLYFYHLLLLHYV